MKQNDFLKLSMIRLVGIAGLVGLFLWSIDCGKPGQLSNVEIAGQLVDYVNRQLPGTHLKTNLKTSIVEPAGKGRYWVTLKNSSFSTDLTWVVNTLSKFRPNILVKNKRLQNSPVPDTDMAWIEEVVLLYGPKEEYLSLRSMKGLAAEFDYKKSGTNPTPAKGFNPSKIRIIIEKITFSDYNIGDMINAGKSKPGKLPIDPETGKAPRSDTTIEHFKIESFSITDNGENLAVIIDIETIKSVNVGLESSESSVLLSQAPVSPKDLEKILEKGLAIIDLNVETGKISISIGKNGIPYGSGGVDSVSYSQFIKPDEKNAFFKVGYGLGLKNLNISIPSDRGMELLSKINDIRFDFSMEHLRPEAVQAILDFVRNSFVTRDISEGAKEQEIQLQVMKAWMGIFNSGPLIKFSLLPFRHYFGEMSAEVNIRSLFPPTGDLKVKIVKIDDILAKIREANLFSPAALKQILETLDKYMIKDKNGDAVMIIELKPDQPGKYFLNGKVNEIKLMKMPQ